MTASVTALGGRLSLLEPQHLSKAQKQTYDQLMATLVPWTEGMGVQSRTIDGKLIGPFNPLLSSPEMGSSFLDFQAAEQKHTTLVERVRQVVILSVGSVWKSPYELYAHVAAAKKAGFSNEAADLLTWGETPDELGCDERVAQRFTRQLASERHVDKAVYDEAEAAFGRTGVADMTILAGTYLLVCALLNAFEVPAPDGRL